MAATWPVPWGGPILENLTECYDAISQRLSLAGLTWNTATGSSDPGTPGAGTGWSALWQYRAATKYLVDNGRVCSDINDDDLPAETWANITLAAWGASETSWRSEAPPKGPERPYDLDDLRDILLQITAIRGFVRGPAPEQLQLAKSGSGVSAATAWADAVADTPILTAVGRVVRQIYVGWTANIEKRFVRIYPAPLTYGGITTSRIRLQNYWSWFGAGWGIAPDIHLYNIHGPPVTAADWTGGIDSGTLTPGPNYTTVHQTITLAVAPTAPVYRLEFVNQEAFPANAAGEHLAGIAEGGSEHNIFAFEFAPDSW